jgi:glyoxylase-like metal-dependent hydrolase (beta-lactamase superfamily II)
MARADEIHRAAADLLIWQAYEPAVKCDLTSTALVVDGGLLLVDPIELTTDALEELVSHGAPRLIVCTSANHARAAETFRKRFGARVAAHAEAAPELGLELDVVLDAEAKLPGGVEVCPLPGGAPGELALVIPGRVICLGDALVHLPQTGLAILPDKYCTEPKLLRASLQNLLRYEFSTLTFAHGLPLIAQARGRLEALLA